MFRRFALSVVAVALISAVAYSATYTAYIFEVKESGKAFAVKIKKGTYNKTDMKMEWKDPETLTVASTVVLEKNIKGTKKGEKAKQEPIENGWKNDMFTKIDQDKGLVATFTTADEASGDVKVGDLTKVTVGKGGKGKAAAQ